MVVGAANCARPQRSHTTLSVWCALGKTGDEECAGKRKSAALRPQRRRPADREREAKWQARALTYLRRCYRLHRRQPPSSVVATAAAPAAASCSAVSPRRPSAQ